MSNLDREYKGHRYRIATRLNEYEDELEYFIYVPRKTWFGFGKEVWEPLVRASYRGKANAQESGCEPFSSLRITSDGYRISFLICWSRSEKETDELYKLMIDSKLRLKKAKRYGHKMVKNPGQ